MLPLQLKIQETEWRKEMMSEESSLGRSNSFRMIIDFLPTTGSPIYQRILAMAPKKRWKKDENTLLLSSCLSASAMIEMQISRGEVVTRDKAFYAELYEEYDSNRNHRSLEFKSLIQCKARLMAMIESANDQKLGPFTGPQKRTLKKIVDNTQSVAASTSSRAANTEDNGEDEVENNAPQPGNNVPPFAPPQPAYNVPLFAAPQPANNVPMFENAFQIIEELHNNGVIDEDLKRKAYVKLAGNQNYLEAFTGSPNKVTFLLFTAG